MKRPKESPSSGVHAARRRPAGFSKSRAIFEEEQKYISPGFQGIALYAGIAFARGSNEIITDEDGREYIDFVSGIGVGSVGHCHPHYVRSLKKQLGQLTYGSFTTAVRMKFLRLLASILPEPLARTQLFSGGAEAVEAAFRLAKSVTKRSEFVGFWVVFTGKQEASWGCWVMSSRRTWGPSCRDSIFLLLLIATGVR